MAYYNIMVFIDWRRYFAKEMLEEGEILEKKRRVSTFKYIEENDCIVGLVFDGTKYYNTSVSKSKNTEGLFFRCSCDGGKRGDLCTHEVAICYTSEKRSPEFFEDRESTRALNKDIDPFFHYDDDDYYFPICYIFSDHFLISQKDWNKAGEVLTNGEANYRIEKSWVYSPKELSLCITSDYDGVDTSLSIVKEGIIDFRCRGDRGCGSSDIYSYFSSRYVSPFRYGSRRKRLCIHKTIAIRAMVEYIAANNPGDTTNIAAENLIDSIVKNRKLFVPQAPKEEVPVKIDSEPVDLVPIFDPSNCDLSFDIGRKKKYKVKKIDIVTGGYFKKDTIKFGKNLIVDFATATFTDRFLSVINFISVSRRNHYYFSDGRINVKYPGENTLYFYDLCSETDVLTKYGGKYRAECIDVRLDAKFFVKNTKNGRSKEIKVVIKYPEAQKWGDSYYSIESDCIYKIDCSSLGPLEEFYPKDYPYEVVFIFGDKSIPVFYNTVLPMLQKVIDIDTNQFPSYEDWKKEKKSYHFLMDYEGDRISCRVNVHEGDRLVGFLQEGMEPGFHSEDNWIIEQVKVFFPNYDGIRNEWYFTEKDEDALYNLIGEGVNVFLELGEVSVSDSLKNISIKKPSPIIINASLTDNLLNLKIESNDIPKKDLMKILDSYRRKKRYHRLSNGDFLILDKSLSEVDKVVDGMDFSQKDLSKDLIQIPRYKALYLDSLLEKRDELITLDRDQSFRRMIKDFKGFETSESEVPSSLSNIMRPYQKDGFRWLSTLIEYGFGGILADEMGLGKTLQIISLILSMKERGEAGTCLVVSPSSLIYNWEAELKKFAPTLKSVVCAGSPKERKMVLCSLSGVDVLITSYDLLKRDIDTYRIRDFLLFVIDEAQYIKNNNTEASKAVKLIHSLHRMALTGTPIENRLSELWSIFDFLMPGFLYSYEKFRTSIELPSMKNTTGEAIEKLRKMTGPFILRRLKSDVLKDLPEKLEEVSYSEMETEQRRLYDAAVLRIRKNIEDEEESEFRKNKVLVLSELTKIREICCDPSLVFENYQGKSAKLDSLMDLMERAIDQGHRMLVFSQFTSMLELIEKRMDSIPYFKITGSTPKEERLRLVDKFNSDASIPVFLISLKAGGTGLNLTGADMVIHYDPWWNVAVQNQATDRAHRLGQTKVVTVYKMIAKNTIEDRIVEMQEAKRDLVEKILSGSETSLASLTREELLEILS